MASGYASRLAFKQKGFWALSNLVKWKVFLPTAGAWNKVIFDVPSNPNYSMILWNKIQKEGVFSLSVNSGTLISVLGLSQRSPDWEKPIKRGTPKICGNNAKKNPLWYGQPSSTGLFYDVLLHFLARGEERPAHLFIQPATHTNPHPKAVLLWYKYVYVKV